jgi:hypothetical protein
MAKTDGLSQQVRLSHMACYDEYSIFLETPGLAFIFNAFVAQALKDAGALEDLRLLVQSIKDFGEGMCADDLIADVKRVEEKWFSTTD